jgi:translation initiation factor IF-2
LAKRVFEIAKELGIASKVIVAKCHAEGVPADVVKNHMSSISIGLETTIREWFSTDGSSSAVETSEKVDIEKARVSAPSKTRAKAKAVAKKIDDVPPAADDDSNVAVADEPAAPVVTAATSTPPPAPTKTRVSSTPAAIAPSAPTTAPAQPAPEPDEPAQPAENSPVEKSDDSPEAPSVAAKAPKPPKQSPPATPSMNVPTRPTTVTPAGPMLLEKTKVKLSGPKVVRVEAAEVLETPRRRAPSGGQGGPGGYNGGGGGGGGQGGPGGYNGGGMPGPGTDSGPQRRGGSNRRRGPATTNRRGGGRPNQGGGIGGQAGGGGASPFRQQDLVEREARLLRSGGFMKRRRQEAKRQGQVAGKEGPENTGPVKIQEPFTIKDLSAATGVKAAEIVKQLFLEGIMATMNSGIDAEKAQEIMLEFDIELDVTEAHTAEQRVEKSFEDRVLVDEQSRGPVVTIMGHVDHGKTSLLDKIRNAKVAEGEAGGITQATSAFKVPVTVGEEQREVVFVDTPGHEAFTAMRSRGANVTDIIVLVVAADDGVMPQTIESIAHSKAAEVPIVVALNKIDKAEADDANIQRIYGQLAEHGLNPTEWGGDIEIIKTSAHTGQGIDELLEVLEYQSQLLELKADFGGAARGTVIESRVEVGRGSVANILVQDGKLSVGDFIVAGPAFGRVRDISDDRGNRIKEALPPMPVQISGIDELPIAGDKFFCVNTLKKAQEAAEQRRERDRDDHLAQPKVTLDTLFGANNEEEVKEILVVIKADVQGSVDVLRNEVEKITTDEVKVRVLHAAAGGITQSDVILAEASKAIIIGFNVIPASNARRLADDKGVEIRTYDVIYHITEDIHKAAEGLLDPELRQEVLGHAEVRQVFKVSKVGTIAGCYVTNGTVERDALIRVTRNDIVIENDRKLEQLKRFKDDAKDVRSGMECGMKIIGYDDIKEGDILECYKQIEVKRKLG